MTALAIESISSTNRSTEEVLRAIQHGLRHQAEIALETVPHHLEAHEQRPFFWGDNGAAWATPTMQGVRLHLASNQLFSERPSGNKLLELTVNYGKAEDGLRPLALSNPASLTVTTSSAHSARHQLYHPKLWEDNGYSLELQDDQGPSLDQGSISRLASFVSEVMQTELKPHPSPR